MPSRKISFCPSVMMRWCMERDLCSVRCRATGGRNLLTYERISPSCGPILARSCSSCGENFAIFSENAEAVEICLFDAEGMRETARIRLPEYTNEVYHGYVRGLKP